MTRMQLQVKVVPGASRNEVTGWLGEALKIRVQAPPEKGKANKAVIRILSELLEVPRRQIELVRGAGSQNKVFAVDGRSMTDARRLVAGAS